LAFKSKADFEEALITLLSTSKGWEKNILMYPTEEDLIKNWADILFNNNRSIDRLNNYPLTDGEMQQILEQIKLLRTPLKLNGFINGKTISIVRDNPDDTAHFGKTISLKIYDRMEVAAGQSRYQIARQPVFKSKSPMLHDRRGDFTLLINGMPVIHVELKKSGIPVSQAYNQIEKYSHEGVFTGLFSLVQVFVAMTPEETVYFANPGPDGKFNPDFYFHWADFNNEPINDWKDVAASLLSIPMAHQLIGFYTVADDTDGILKVMRSYQYYAANAISDKVSKIRWDEKGHQLGGHIWHTTGSGKTMTSFKSAQLIADSNVADKVIFLVDRIELGTQSLEDYKGFADDRDNVQGTENKTVLISKLKSNNPAEVLIVTSIQKLSQIREDCGLNSRDLDLIRSKRIVIIVDEAHRSTFGDMLMEIKDILPDAVLFGFTGTPIGEENQKKMNTTATIFGSELHRYTIADGIRDKNVLGFDTYKVLTFKDREVRQQVALGEAKAATEEEAISDPDKSKVYYEFMDPSKRKMCGYYDDAGVYVRGIEDYLPNSQYETDEHQKMVVEDIKENWTTLSHNGKFHALFATHSIPEAIAYYRLIKAEMPELKATCLFDPNIDNVGGAVFKEDGLIEIIDDYNKRYDKKFSLPTHAKFKKDIALRLAHKKPYTKIENDKDQQIDLLIVVDQMLTGFDSKWINTLYLDKVLRYEGLIQAFSRTNRLFGPDKPFGVIRYYRRPHTMERNIRTAVKYYSGDRPVDLFVEKLKHNLETMNIIFGEIKYLFKQAGVPDFKKLPDEMSERAKFATLFNDLNDYLEAAKIQGFRWDELTYSFDNPDTGAVEFVTLDFDKTIYLILLQRYKELLGPGGGPGCSVPYDLKGYLTEIDTDVIDNDYMNTRFTKYLKVLHQTGASQAAIDEALEELHKTFATLSQEEQRFANVFLHDVQRGDVQADPNKTFRDYVTEYMAKAKDDQIHRFASTFGLNEAMLRAMMVLKLTKYNIDEFGRFQKLKATVDKDKAKAYFEAVEGKKLIPPKVNIKIDNTLRDFILTGGFDISEIGK
jgi:type I restriction enzyme R subunit